MTKATWTDNVAEVEFPTTGRVVRRRAPKHRALVVGEAVLLPRIDGAADVRVRIDTVFMDNGQQAFYGHNAGDVWDTITYGGWTRDAILVST